MFLLTGRSGKGARTQKIAIKQFAINFPVGAFDGSNKAAWQRISKDT
jgi:hypothetical protein